MNFKILTASLAFALGVQTSWSEVGVVGVPPQIRNSDIALGAHTTYAKEREDTSSYAKLAIRTDVIPAVADAYYADKRNTAPLPFFFPGMMRMMRGGKVTVVLTISTDQAAQYNIRTAALASPNWPSTGVANVVVTLNNTIACKAGITTGSGWAAGCTILFINNGTNAGTGGGGGSGESFTSTTTTFAATAGSAGGDAVTLGFALTIDNTNGVIYGGGGGGGGGGAGSSDIGTPYTAANTVSGSSGGGARSYNNAPGGSAGGNSLGGAVGLTGAAGSSATAGAGGPQTVSTSFTGSNGAGGNGGDFGAAGSTGATAGGPGYLGVGAAGGAAGKAIAKNGFTLTFTLGNNGTQVKGAIV